MSSTSIYNRICKSCDAYTHIVSLGICTLRRKTKPATTHILSIYIVVTKKIQRKWQTKMQKIQ